jgi:hypothetical protein
MLNWWLHLRLHRGWAAEAYSRALPTADVEAIVLGAALVAMGLIAI